MGLPTSQQRVLDTIECELAESDPRLESLFRVFTRLTAAETMPWVEQIRPRRLADRLALLVGPCGRLAGHPVARMRAMVLVPAALAVMLCTLVAGVALAGVHRSSPGTRVTATNTLPRSKQAPPPCDDARFEPVC